MFISFHKILQFHSNHHHRSPGHRKSWLRNKRKSHTRNTSPWKDTFWRLQLLPSVYGIFAYTFAMTTYFANVLRIHLVDCFVKAFGYFDDYKIPAIVFLKRLKKPPDLFPNLISYLQTNLLVSKQLNILPTLTFILVSVWVLSASIQKVDWIHIMNQVVKIVNNIEYHAIKGILNGDFSTLWKYLLLQYHIFGRTSPPEEHLCPSYDLDYLLPEDNAQLPDSTIATDSTQESKCTIPISLGDANFCRPSGIFLLPHHQILCACQSHNSKVVSTSKSQLSRVLKSIPCQGNKSCKLIFDTGASKCSIGICSDFVEYAPITQKVILDGIASGLPIAGYGVVKYNIYTGSNEPITLELKAYHVPGLNDDRLVSPQRIVTTNKLRGSFEAHCNDDDPESFAILRLREPGPYWQFTDPIHQARIKYNHQNNLPELTGYFHDSHQEIEHSIFNAVKVTKEHNENLSRPQKDLLRLHFCLGHINMQHIQWLIRQGKVRCHNAKSIGKICHEDLPKCAGCRYGKMMKQPTKTTKTVQRPSTIGNLKKDKLLPGECVASDQYVCAEPSRLYTSKGQTPRQNRFSGGTIFCDVSSRYIAVRHQVSLASSDTIQSKLSYEQELINKE